MGGGGEDRWDWGVRVGGGGVGMGGGDGEVVETESISNTMLAVTAKIFLYMVY